MKLSEHINEVMAEFDERKLLQACHCCDCEKQIKSFLEKSLKSIAYKSIDAVRVEEKEPVKWSKEDRKMGRMIEGQKDDFQLPRMESVQTNGIDNYNLAIQKSAQKEKEYKDD